MAVTDRHATIEELLEAMFSMRSVQLVGKWIPAVQFLSSVTVKGW
jgi:hypothetical protein